MMDQSTKNTSSVSRRLPRRLPLAEQIRPQMIDEIIGQDHLLKKKSGIIRKFIETGFLPSLVFWGPPGTGKTTLAKVIAQELNCEFHLLSAVSTSVQDLKKIFSQIEDSQEKKSILFLDEIHRFNKLQQDSLLGVTEKGRLTLIGATTENPSFSINNALLSRIQVYVLNPLEKSHLKILLARVEKFLKTEFKFEPEAQKTLFNLTDGDGRRLIGILEKIYQLFPNQKITKNRLLEVVQEAPYRYDSHEEEHYNLISALHKSLRGSDCDAGLYWLARMLGGGEDPHYLFRRLLRFAYEDIGLADPEAAIITLTAWQTYERLGSPEGEVALAEVVIYLALAPKSNRVYQALNQVITTAKKYGSLPPPKHILNAPTELMKQQDYGKGYLYDHDQKDSFSGQSYFPEKLKEKVNSKQLSFYKPIKRGFEREMTKRLDYFNQLREKRNKKR